MFYGAEVAVCSQIQGDQKVFVHLMITIQSSGAQRLFDHPVNTKHINTVWAERTIVECQTCWHIT